MSTTVTVEGNTWRINDKVVPAKEIQAHIDNLEQQKPTGFWNSFWGGASTVLAALAVFWIAANGGISIVGGGFDTGWSWVTTTGVKILGWVALILLFAGAGGWILNKFTKKKGEG